MDTVARTEMVEKELDTLITRRSRKGESTPDELEEIYAESVRRYNVRRREQNRWEWIRFYDRMAETHAAMSKEYAGRAERLLEVNE